MTETVDYNDFLATLETERRESFLIRSQIDNSLIGLINLNEIIRGAFQNTFVGYFGFAETAGKGFITEALFLVMKDAFEELYLHRMEINIQPENHLSIKLVERLKFTKEGISKKYLKIMGKWKDHVKYSMVTEDWILLKEDLLKSIEARNT